MGEGVNDFRKWITRLSSCVGCNGVGVLHEDGHRYLHPHHVRTRAAGGKDENNLLCLCWRCHAEIHQLGLPRWETKRCVDAKKTASVLFGVFGSGVDAREVRVGDARVGR